MNKLLRLSKKLPTLTGIEIQKKFPCVRNVCGIGTAYTANDGKAESVRFYRLDGVRTFITSAATDVFRKQQMAKSKTYNRPLCFDIDSADTALGLPKKKINKRKKQPII